MRTLVEINKLVLDKYKLYDHESSVWNVYLCLFVKFALFNKKLTTEECNLWYNNFLNYKPANVIIGEVWWVMRTTENDIAKRIEILETILKDSIEEENKSLA